MPRLTAYEALRSGSATPLREVDRIAGRRGLDPRDRALARAISGIEVRRRATLQALVHHLARRKVKPELAALLRIGLAQLFFLDRIPNHAAVSETVAATQLTLGLAKGRFVNACLRAAIRAREAGHSGDPRRDIPRSPWRTIEPLFPDPAEHPLLWAEQAFSMPAPLLKGWEKRYGRERALQLAADALVEPPLSIRAIEDRRVLAEELHAAGVETRQGAHPAILLAASADTEAVVASVAFAQGRATIQGETALRAAELVAAKPGERVLDACAAPGGKTAVLAAGGASVVALDPDPARLERLRETLDRLGLGERVEVRTSAIEDLPPDERFDAVLVDAPCSNTGVLAQRPGARWRWGPAARKDLAGLQSALLEAAARHVRPGGRLVWSTCSIEPEENQARVRAFLAEHGEFERDAELSALPAPAAPAGPVDGGWAARLVRA